MRSINLRELRSGSQSLIAVVLLTAASWLPGCAGHPACAPDCAKSPKPAGTATATEPEVFQALYGDEVAPPDLLKPPADAERSPSGLASQRLSAGEGDTKPSERDEVTFHYTGWGPTGQRFASTFGAKPQTAVVAELAPGWAEAIQMMAKGERRRFWIPELLARSPDMPEVPPGDIVLEMELLELLRASSDAPPAAPADVAKAPEGASQTASGLKYVELEAGTGTRHPGPSEVVEVRYTGWTSEGQMFDSSFTRGLPAKFRVDEVIPGWTEVLQLMTPGAHWRVWIPTDLAYGDSPQSGQPAGDLTFEIELLNIL